MLCYIISSYTGLELIDSTSSMVSFLVDTYKITLRTLNLCGIGDSGSGRHSVKKLNEPSIVYFPFNIEFLFDKGI